MPGVQLHYIPNIVGRIQWLALYILAIQDNKHAFLAMKYILQQF